LVHFHACISAVDNSSDDQILMDSRTLDSSESCEDFPDELSYSETECFDGPDDSDGNNDPNLYPNELLCNESPFLCPDELPCNERPSEYAEELLWSETDPFNYGNEVLPNETEDPHEVHVSHSIDHEPPQQLNHCEELSDQPPDLSMMNIHIIFRKTIHHFIQVHQLQ